MIDQKQILDKTLDIAHELGYSEILAEYESGEEWQIRFSNSSQDIFKRWEVEKLEIFVVKDGKTTEIEIKSPSIEDIRKKLASGLKFLEHTPKSQFYLGMESQVKTIPKIDGLYDSRIKNFHQNAPSYVNNAIESALEAGAKKVAGVLYFGGSNISLKTSYGFENNYDSSYYRSTIRTFVDAESSGQDIIVGRNLESIKQDLITSGTKAGEIAKMAVKPKAGKAGTYDVILSPTVAANIFGEITSGANPLLIMLGMSPLQDKLDQQIGNKGIHIYNDSLIGEGLGTRPFDAEGTPTQRFSLINDGKFVQMVHNTSSAKMSNTQSTGNSVLAGFGAGSKILAPFASNFVYSPGDYSKEEIFQEAKKPTIYITSNWYTRFTNQLEGIFSTIPRDGLFYVENGEIQYPIRNVRLSDNLLRMFQSISQLGKEIQQIQWWEVNTPTFIPMIKVKDCNITAATQ